MTTIVNMWSKRPRRGLLLVAGALASAGIIAAAFAGVSMKIGNETEPPNGVVQMKVFITEPKPISTGGTKLAMDEGAIDDIWGIALYSTAGDASGAAVVRGSAIQLSYSSPSGTFGMDPDYPVISVAAHVRADAPIGYKATLNLDAAGAWFTDPFGVPYASEMNPGQLTVAPGVSITNVTPGSATVRAGGVVTLWGVNFHPLSTVRFKEAKLSQVRYIDPTRIDVVLAGTTHMHGQHIRVSNPDGSSSTYFSYQRTTPARASVHALLNATYPLFAEAHVRSATFAFAADTAATYSGIAVQNTGAATANITVSRLDSGGTVVATGTFQVPANARVLGATAEFVGSAPVAGSAVRVEADAPVQMLGVIADETGSGTVAPVRALFVSQ
jgi:hypothetical protein